MRKIALIGENSIEYIDILLDIWNSGDCAVLIDWRIPPLTIIDMLQTANVEICYIEKQLYTSFPPIKSEELSFITFEHTLKSPQLLPKYIYQKYRNNYEHQPAIIIYSSGTTGVAKGIILSHFAINSNADSIIANMDLNNNDRFYIVKSITHSSTLVGELLVALKTHCDLLISPTIIPPRLVLQNIYEHHISILCLNPTILSLLVNEFKKNNGISPLPLRKIYVSGSILQKKLHQYAKSLFSSVDIFNMYGLSEAGPRVCMQHASCCSCNSVGKPLVGINVLIVDDFGKIVAKGVSGIIHVKTPSIFDGYVSGNKTTPSLFEDWLNTGDIGYFDEYDELHIVGRVDDVIMVNSHKIYPKEIERQILMNPKIHDCAIIKISYNDEFLVCLYVADEIINENIKAMLSSRFMVYEIPRNFIKIDSLPTNNNGKFCAKTAEKIAKKYIEEQFDGI